jgi:Beta/Gamma crystallin
MQGFSKAVFPVILFCVACLAQAGEVILFEQSDFRGRTLTLRGTAPNLDSINFNDRASSVRVLSGVWELCTDAYFRGRCATFGPGDYPDLGGQSKSYSSVRELVSLGRNRPPLPPSDGAIVLFDEEGFRGRGFGISSATPDLDPTGFNDRARSLIVKSGDWEVCTDADYRGRCRIFSKGEYPALDLGLNDQISSARPSGYNANPNTAGSTWFGAGNGSIVLFEHDNFRGKSRTLDGPVENFDQIDFNDMVSSLVVRRGLWELCTDAEFRGTCHVYRPGEYRSVGPRLNDQFSSARLVGQ